MKKFIIPLVCILAASCAQDSTMSTGDQSREYLEKWMAKNHPGIPQEESGLYILSDTPGSGDALTEDYIYATVTIRTLSGTISSTQSEVLAKQLGTYTEGNYYGPSFLYRGEGYSYAGVDAILEGMRIGGKRRAIIPSWMLTTSRFSSQGEYFAACTSMTSLDYEIEISEQCADIQEWENDLLAKYVADNFSPSIESIPLSGDEEGDGSFYFITIQEGDTETELENGNELTLHYTGKLLNGTVFDSTEAESGESNPVTIYWYNDYTSVTMNGSSSLIDGFKAGISHILHPGGSGIVLFTSSHGYSSSGGGNGVIPSYAPLIFELETEAYEQ